MLYGYPPFVSKSRQITRQKVSATLVRHSLRVADLSTLPQIANWKTTLRFPAQPRISREAQDLIASLICEREDRLGSRSTASVSRPNSTVINQRRGSIAQPQPAGSAGGVQADGVEEIMVSSGRLIQSCCHERADSFHLTRPTPSSVASTGLHSISKRRPSCPSLLPAMTRVILRTTLTM